MVLVKEINWISIDALEASVLIKEENVEIWCFYHPCKLEPGQLFESDLHCFFASDIVKIESKKFNYSRTGKLSYELTGQVLEKKDRLLLLGSLEIELDVDFPGDVYNGDFVQLHCLRIDIW